MKDQAWWDGLLPGALDAAISAGAGGKYHAIVVDEGQDFARSWLESLYLMLTDPDHDVLYVFHDPEQVLYRDDVVDSPQNLLGSLGGWSACGPAVVSVDRATDDRQIVLPLPGRAPCSSALQASVDRSVVLAACGCRGVDSDDSPLTMSLCDGLKLVGEGHCFARL